MGDPVLYPVMTAEDAASIGFAQFNSVPTLPVDILDGGFTISAKTSEGRRLTLSFGPDVADGPARFVDIQYHDSGGTVPDAAGKPAPVFDMFTIGERDARVYDSRRDHITARPSIAVILLSDRNDDER